MPYCDIRCLFGFNSLRFKQLILVYSNLYKLLFIILFLFFRLELMYKLEEHEGCVNSLNFHPNGSYLASGSDDLRVVVWDWKIGKCLLSYDTKHKTNVFQSKFLNLSGDLHIVTCARDGQVSIYLF